MTSARTPSATLYAPPGPSGAAQPVPPDAAGLIDAIEREWALYGRLQRAEESPEVEAAFEASSDRRDALLDAVDVLPATSREARHAKALALAWIRHVDGPTWDQPRHQCATDERLAIDIEGGVVAGGGTAPAAVRDAASGADPVVALIEAHRAAHTAWRALSDVANGTPMETEAYAAADAAEDEPLRREVDAMNALLAARPMTIAGTLALAEYLVEATAANSIADDTDWEAALRTITASLRATLPATTPDPALVAMVAKWAALRDRMNAPGWIAEDEVEDGERLSALERAIHDHPSAGLADLAAKAPLLAIELTDVDPGPHAAEGRPVTAWSAWSGVVRDLQRLGAPWTPAGPPASPVPAPHPDAALLALGAEFDAAHAAWLATWPAHHAAMARFERQRTRLRRHGVDERDGYARAWTVPGVVEAHKAEKAAFVRLEPLNAAILALPAHTIDGLAVKARAVAVTRWTAGDYEHASDEEWGDEHLRDLVESACALAGVDHLGRPVVGVAPRKAGGVA